jgi:hypothetical protein
MSIHFISGKPRGGKTLYSVSKIIGSLVAGRYVVTNVALHLERLQCHLHEKHPDLNVHVLERVVMLDDDMLGEFWRYRRNDFTMSLDCVKDDRTIDFTAVYDAECFNTDFYLDEVHVKFNARSWQKTGPQAINYLSQHGKLGDNVYMITQSIANVDKQFRSVAQDFSYIRNYRVEKFRGFTRGSNFERKTYLQPVSGNSEVPVEKESFTLDKAIAGCYDTSGGVGMPGGAAADKGAKAKGVPLKMIIALVVIGLIGGGWFVNSWVIPKLFKKAVRMGTGADLKITHRNSGGMADGEITHRNISGDDGGVIMRPYRGVVVIDGVRHVMDDGALYKIIVEGPQGIIAEGNRVYVHGYVEPAAENNVDKGKMNIFGNRH